MTWGKMDDKFHRNAKVRELRRMKGGREALGDWAFWWSWCLDDPALSGVVPAFELDASDLRSAKLLVLVGLWDEVEGGYAFHDFHEYNPRREQREAKKAADRERVAEKRAANRANVASDNKASRERQQSESRGCPTRVASTRDPVPSRPVPNPSDPRERVEHHEVVALYARLRAEAHQAKHGRPGGTYRRTTRDWQPIQDLAEFATESGIGALEDSLRGYLVDEWAIGAGWPVSTWAKDPGRYMGRAGVPGTTRVASRVAEIEAEIEAAEREVERVRGTDAQRPAQARVYELQAKLARAKGVV